MKPARADHRKDRIARLEAKRPRVTVHATVRRPPPDRRAAIIDGLLDLLDELRRSGGR